MALNSYVFPIEFYIIGVEVHDSKAAPTLITYRYVTERGLYHC